MNSAMLSSCLRLRLPVPLAARAAGVACALGCGILGFTSIVPSVPSACALWSELGTTVQLGKGFRAASPFRATWSHVALDHVHMLHRHHEAECFGMG